MIVMFWLVLSPLFPATVNCQLGYIWLHYHHFKCSQNTNNYRESIRHEYLCSFSLIWKCIWDVNDYSHNANIFLDYFCGFIDGQNALQSQTIWNIYMKPNVNIHFLKFFLLDNHWYCDYEYLRVYSNNKTTTFCGRRYSWVHDASDTKVKIILMTQRTRTKNYQLELLYYGAYIPNYQHFIIFTHSSPLRNIHYPNTEQNAFESFQLISGNRLDIMELKAMNTCSKGQVVCYDGPGFKSPRLQFTYNQSVGECLSSTFQMMCKFSREDGVCSNGPRLYYCAIHARDHHVNYLRIINHNRQKLEIDGAHSKGTSKYIYRRDTASPRLSSLYIWRIPLIAFRYMLYEGNSCMYGGIYIVQTISSKDSEILSLCTPASRYIPFQHNISVVIIHYSEYSTEQITFKAIYRDNEESMDLTQTYKENTLNITVPKVTKALPGYIYSYLLKLRNILYINISCDAIIHSIKFEAITRAFCMNITIFYYPHPSNIWGRQYDQQTISGLRSVVYIYREFVQSVFINMSACTLVEVPVWVIIIRLQDKFGSSIYTSGDNNITDFFYLPVDILNVRSSKSVSFLRPKRSYWVLVHMRKPEDVPAYMPYGEYLQS